jgi:hypothetical protein
MLRDRYQWMVSAFTQTTMVGDRNEGCEIAITPSQAQLLCRLENMMAEDSKVSVVEPIDCRAAISE